MGNAHYPRIRLKSTGRYLVWGSIGAVALSFGERTQASETLGLRGSQPSIAQVHSESVLRGSKSEFTTGSVPQDVSGNQYDDTDVRPDSHSEERTSSGITGSLRNLIKNSPPSVFFRGTQRAVSERDVSIPLPKRHALRNSILPDDTPSYDPPDLLTDTGNSTAAIGETMAAALRGSYSARAQLERANADRARLDGAVAAFLPRVNANANIVGGTTDSNRNSSNSRNRSSAGVEITMPLFTSGVNLNTYRQSKHVSIASDLSYVAEERRVALEAVAAHVNLRLNRKVERTLEKNVAAMKRISHIASRLFKAGDASRTDIETARANVERARAELDIARRSREDTKTDYESLTNLQAPAQLASGRVEHLIPSSVDEAIDYAYRHNPVLESSLHSAVASQYAVKAERGRFGPQISAFGRYDREFNNSSNNNSSRELNVGIQLQLPLFDASIASSVGAARHDALEAEYRSLDQARLVESQIRRQWSAYQSATRRVGIIRREAKALASSVEGARREYEAGFRSITDVLDAQVRLARAQITLENAVHERILAAYELAFTTSNPAVVKLAILK